MKRSKISHPDDQPLAQLRLFSSGVGRRMNSLYPQIERSAAGIRKFLSETAGPETPIGIDLEFGDRGPTVLGLACGNFAGAVRWDQELARYAVALATERQTTLVGHSIVDADKPQVEEATGLKTPLDLWDDSMIAHWCNNAILCGMAGKDEEEGEAGSLGMMNLWAATSMVLAVPNWKDHWGAACTGYICPTCVTGDTKVWMADGTKQRINKLVRNKLYQNVLSVDKFGGVVSRPIVAHYVSSRNNRELYRLGYMYENPLRGGGSKKRVIVTEDHPVKTINRGYVRADKLLPSDLIDTGYEDFGDKAKRFLCGFLLGDGHITKQGQIKIVHSLKQYGYLKIKQRLFNRSTIYQQRDGIGITLPITPPTRFLSKQRQFNWLDYLSNNFTVESLAAWYLDDGCYHKHQGLIAVSSKTNEEINHLIELCKKTLNSDDIILRDTGVRKDIRFGSAAMVKLAEAISPYTPACLRYKLRHPHAKLTEFNPSLWSPGTISTFGASAIVSKVTDKNVKQVFCLGVEETNNFITDGGVLHNCDVLGYCAMDAYGGLKVFEENIRKIQKRGAYNIYDFRLRLTEVCVQMSRRGVRVDLDYIRTLDGEFAAKKETLFPSELHGRRREFEHFNPGSPKQVLEFFQNHNIALKSAQKKDTLKALEKQFAKAKLNLDATLERYKEALEDEGDTFRPPQGLPLELDLLCRLYLFKSEGKGLASWFDDKYIQSREGSIGIIHPRFNTTGTLTSRLSSSRPNFQNLVSRGFGAKVRKGVIANSPDEVIVKIDFGQLELRKVLHAAEVDPSRIPKDIFKDMVERSGENFMNAAKEFTPDKFAQNPLKAARDIAKSVSYGNIYGEGMVLLGRTEMSSAQVKKEVEEKALLVIPGWTFRNKQVAFTGANLAERLFHSSAPQFRRKALEIQEYYYQIFPENRLWHQRVCREIEDSNVVTTANGHMVELYTEKDVDAVRTAFSVKGQGEGALAVQEKMLWLADAEPLLQVHDELVFSKPKAAIRRIALEIAEVMQRESKEFPGFRCPVSVKYGPSWYEPEMEELKVEF